MSRALWSVLLALLLVACSKGPAEGTAAAAVAGSADAAAPTPLPAGAALPAPGQEAVKPVPAQLPDVIARVNGQVITKAEFERAVKDLEGQAGGPVPAEQRDGIYRGVLDRLVGFTLLSQEATARKVAVPDAELEAQMARIRSQFPSEEAFTQLLAARGMTLAQARSEARGDMLVSKLLEQEVEKASAVTPAQVTEFYTKSPDQFRQDERVKASHILISLPQGADAAAKAQARTRAEQVLAEVKTGKDFAALAKQHSQDPGSAVQGGDLGYFTQGQMVGPFNDAAFSLAPGTTSGLVETQFGFHIIRVVEKQAPRAIPLEEVRPQVEQFLLQQNRQRESEAFVNRLKAKGKVELYM